jgi:hypothetical protein
MHNPMQAEGAAWGERGARARSDTQLGDGEMCKENPRGKPTVKRARMVFRVVSKLC